MKNSTKNKAAVLLGKLRWAGKSDEEKLKHSLMMVAARQKKRAVTGVDNLPKNGKEASKYAPLDNR